MAGPDLEPVRRLVEGYLDDDVRLLRDQDRVGGGELDDATGLIGSDGADPQVWAGKGMLLPAGAPPTAAVAAAAPVEVDADAYSALIPLGAPAARAGDVLLVVTSRRDPQLTGRRFTVRGPGVTGTYAVLRRLTLDPVPA